MGSTMTTPDQIIQLSLYPVVADIASDRPMPWGFFLLVAAFVAFVTLMIIVINKMSPQEGTKALALGEHLHGCPTCGVELPGDAPEGLCPRCLLKQGLSSPG